MGQLDVGRGVLATSLALVQDGLNDARCGPLVYRVGVPVVRTHVQQGFGDGVEAYVLHENVRILCAHDKGHVVIANRPMAKLAAGPLHDGDGTD